MPIGARSFLFLIDFEAVFCYPVLKTKIRLFLNNFKFREGLHMKKLGGIREVTGVIEAGIAPEMNGPVQYQIWGGRTISVARANENEKADKTFQKANDLNSDRLYSLATKLLRGEPFVIKVGADSFRWTISG